MMRNSVRNHDQIVLQFHEYPRGSPRQNGILNSLLKKSKVYEYHIDALNASRIIVKFSQLTDVIIITELYTLFL